MTLGDFNMYDTRYPRDDIIPMLRDAGIAATLQHWLKTNASQEFLIELIQMEHSVVLLPAQVRQLISDLKAVAALEGADVADLPQAITRPAAPTGIGCSGGNVWVTPPAIETTLRFYVNGVHKLSQVCTPDPANGYLTTLTTIGAVAGDVVQVAAVAPADVIVDEIVVTAKGTVGWWTRITAV